VVEAATGRALGPVLDCPGMPSGLTICAAGKTVAISYSPNPALMFKDPASVVLLVQPFDAASGKPIGRPFSHPRVPGRPETPRIIRALAFSPDGKTLLTGGSDQLARRWDVVSGKEVGRPLEHPGPISSVAFSPDSQVIAIAGSQLLRLWDAATGMPLGSGLAHPKEVLKLAFRADGKTLVTAGSDGGVCFWEVASGRQTGRIETTDGLLLCVAFHRESGRILTGSTTGVARLWDVATGKPIGPPLAHPQNITAAVFQANGQAVLTATLDGTIRTWDLARTNPTPSSLTWQAEASINALAFHPDGQSVLTAGNLHAARFWDARTGAASGPPLPHPFRVVKSVAFRADGKVALTAGWGLRQQGDDFSPVGAVFRWDPASGKLLGRLIDSAEYVTSATFVRDGQAVLVVSAANGLGGDLKVRLVDAVSGQPTSVPLKPGALRVDPGAPRVDHVAISSDGSRLVTGSMPGKSAQVWDFATGQALGKRLEHHDEVTAVAFSPDGRTVATGCKDKVARLWDAATGAPLGQAMAHRLPVDALAFSPDSKTLLVGCSDPLGTAGDVCLWDATSGQPMAPPRSFSSLISSIAFRGDGQAVAAATLDGTVSIWRPAAPVTEDVEPLRRRLEVWTGLELHDTVAFRPLTPEAWLQRKQELDADKGP
jgi:WD40 repeat protein